MHKGPCITIVKIIICVTIHYDVINNYTNYILYLLSNCFHLSTYLCREELLKFNISYHAANKEWFDHSTALYRTFIPIIKLVI